MFNDPFQLLKVCLKENVEVKMNNGESYTGILEGFDEHINVMLTQSSVADSKDRLLFLRGENILFVGIESADM